MYVYNDIYIYILKKEGNPKEKISLLNKFFLISIEIYSKFYLYRTWYLILIDFSRYKN